MPNFYDLNDDGQLNGSDKGNPKNQQGGAFVVYWSVSAKYDGENSQPGKKVTHVLWAATKDFTNETYMFGGVFVPTQQVQPGQHHRHHDAAERFPAHTAPPAPA